MPDFITTAEAASRKGCTRQAIINAIAREDLNAFKLGATWAVHDDDALAAYTVRETGGRTHRDRDSARLGTEAEGAEAVATTGAEVSADT